MGSLTKRYPGNHVIDENRFFALFTSLRNFSSDQGLNIEGSDPNVRDMLEYQRGDESAFSRIYQRNKRKIYSWVYRMLQSQHLSEEITQEVFLRVARSKGSYRPEAKFTTWLYTIASRLVFNETRRQNRKPEEGWSDYFDQTVPDVSDSWMDRAEIHDRRKRLEEALSNIPERQRAAVMLRYIQGFSHDEIGQMLGISDQATKSLLHRGLVSLVKYLEEAGQG